MLNLKETIKRSSRSISLWLRQSKQATNQLEVVTDSVRRGEEKAEHCSVPKAQIRCTSSGATHSSLPFRCTSNPHRKSLLSCSPTLCGSNGTNPSTGQPLSDYPTLLEESLTPLIPFSQLLTITFTH